MSYTIQIRNRFPRPLADDSIDLSATHRFAGDILSNIPVTPHIYQQIDARLENQITYRTKLVAWCIEQQYPPQETVSSS